MAEISKAYEPQAVEEKWYNFWLKQNCFVAGAHSSKPAYSIVIPPPNVTGMLHMGHVLNNTIQDILSRKARMEGKEVLWLPGTDHAGIGTQTVVEKNLRKQGLMKHREDIGREKFLEHVWAWKEKHGGIIIQQLKKLPGDKFTARFRCVMVLATQGELLGSFEGIVEGEVIPEERGSEGFGYDCMFIPKGYAETFGELQPEIKNSLSHRGRALARVLEFLRS